MKCQNPLSFFNNEEMFTRVLDTTQDLSDDVRFHLEQCELCQNDLMHYKQVNQKLLSSLYRKQCPTSMVLSAYATNMLEPDEQLPIQVHLCMCPLCTAEVDEVRRFFTDTEGMI